MRWLLGSAPFAIAALCGPGVACAETQSIHAGDKIYIRVFGHPELSESLVLDARGEVSLPMTGTIAIGGLSSKDAAARIDLAYRSFLRYPAAEVDLVSEGTSIFVAGGPGGVLKYASGETLATALADIQSGDTTIDAKRPPDLADIYHSRIDLHRVSIDRDGATLGIYDVLALSQNGQTGPELLPGDTIALADKPVAVQVLGQVVNPGTTYLYADEPLNDAIAQVGGLAPDAATANISFTRGSTVSDVALGDQSLNNPATAGDSLVVPSAPRVNVAGLVEKPGPVTLKTDFTLLSAMYNAGGPQKYANITDVQVLHHGQTSHYDVTKLTHGDVTQNPSLSDGDTVFVPEGHKIDFSSVFQAIGALGLLVRPF